MMTKHRGTMFVIWFACFALACSALLAMPAHKDTDVILEGRISQRDLSDRYSWFVDARQKYVPDAGVVNALLPYSG